jgi:inhibitor of cysteine peptidase
MGENFVIQGVRRNSMKKTVALVFLLIVVSGILLGCTSRRTVSIDDVDNGRTVDVNTGDTLKISLAGNPTTGYNWYATSLDTTVLQQVGEPGFKASSNAIGAGGVITLSFQALKAGQIPLTLEYKRIWETGIPALQTYNVIVVVK